MSDLLAIVRNLNRLAAVHRSGLLDTGPEEPFDRFTRLAARIFKTPVALVSLVDADRQFFKSASACRSRGRHAGRPRSPIHSASTRLRSRNRW
jgi:hypothetical protein